MKTNWTISAGSLVSLVQHRAKAKRLLFCAALGVVLGCSVVPPAFGQFQFERLKSFSSTGGDGAEPEAALVVGSDGALYGTTSHGGSNNVGTVFKLGKDGSGYTVLSSFGGGNGNGERGATLMEGSDGDLYGTTLEGGSNHNGIVFKLRKDGGDYTVLYNFGAGGDGDGPMGALIEGSEGALYGTTYWGGNGGAGTVFKLKKDGTGYAVLHNFVVEDGEEPTAAVVEASDGVLYGTTSWGGRESGGTVFKLSKDGGGYAVLHNFSWTGGDGLEPLGALLEGNDGNLYGTTFRGGSERVGTVFKLNKDGSGYTILHSLSAPEEDYRPWELIGLESGLMEGHDGALCGTTRGSAGEGAGTVFKLNKDGSGYAILHRFTGGDGVHPSAGLVMSNEGALYGTTASGGDMGFGVIFALRPQPVMLPLIISGGGVTLRFTSVPGSTHRLQRAGTLDGSWMTLTNLVVPTGGVAEFTDPAPPQPSGFYRTIAP